MASGNVDGRTAPIADSTPSSFHSRYDPVREAARHVDAVLAGKRPSVIFIIGGGLNYIGSVAAERFPKATRVSLQPSDIFDGKELDSPSLRWSPSSGSSLYATISMAVADNRLAGGVAIVEWPPVVARFEAGSERIRRVLRDVLETASADSATTGFWASRWLRNSVRFAIAVSGEAAVARGDGPIVVACAGPSLESSLPGIRRVRADIALWALASAVPALLKGGLRPDMTVSTDPGFWNGSHLRASRDAGIPIAMPPSAFASGETLSSSDVLSLDTGLCFERIAIDAAGLSSERTSPAGSAAGSALALALRLTSGRVLLAGYDLAALGLQEHCRPYSFDVLDETSEARLSPALSARTARVLTGYPEPSGPWRRSRAFSAYAATIRASPEDEDRVFRSGTSPIETGMRRGGIDDIMGGSGEPPVCMPLAGRRRRTEADTRAAMRDALCALADRSLYASLAAIKEGTPLPYEATLFYKALAPKTAAPLIADAARGQSTVAAAAAADAAAREAALAVTLGEAC
jgi:hypothetical protein